MRPTTKETNDVNDTAMTNELLSGWSPSTDTCTIDGETARKIIARLRATSSPEIADRATWADVLVGDHLRLGHDGKLCRVVRVSEQDDEYLAVTTDCGSGEHVAIVPRTGAVR